MQGYDIQTIILWTMSGNGRLAAAAALFAIVWCCEYMPIVREQLTTPSRKRLALLIVGTGPAIVSMLATHAPYDQIVATLLTAVPIALGLQSFRKQEPDLVRVAAANSPSTKESP